MVQKYCPTCKDLIPVACKSCPCGHKFVKTVLEPDKSEQPRTLNDSPLGREASGRPRRRSAMNSLYYHSSLNLSSYTPSKLAKKEATSGTDSTGTQQTENGSDIVANPVRVKRRRGRPRLTPLPKLEHKEEKEEAEEVETKPKEAVYPALQQRRTGLIYNRLRSASALYHSSHSTSDNSKLSKSNRAVNESESYTKLYQSLSPEKKTHFAHILTDINLKFMKNSNFPL
ncbi:uncharacterized protein [Watersipora subatra]|uniref:uncharacterized protein n=1 Tax=Watersipora subatra TaxID=2589382 RepID=UPI00355C906E